MLYLPFIIAILALALILLLIVTAPPPTAKDAAGLDENESAPERPITRRATRGALPSEAPSIVRRQDRSKKITLRERLIQAGLYRDGFATGVQALRFFLLGLCLVGGYLAFDFGFVTFQRGMFLGITSGLAATFLPVLMLDRLKARRQQAMRRALPDALDVVVICLQGGLSLPAAFARVSRELADAHPELSIELRIVEREVQMGMTLGEAMKNFAARFDLEELRNLAMVVNQSDRFGASVTRSFKVFASSMRTRRQQKAEELAHKASVKLLVPCALLIFPAMFVVTLAPAVYRAFDVLSPLIEEMASDLEQSS